MSMNEQKIYVTTNAFSLHSLLTGTNKNRKKPIYTRDFTIYLVSLGAIHDKISRRARCTGEPVQINHICFDDVFDCVLIVASREV